jgi:hypothetical protein
VNIQGWLIRAKRWAQNPPSEGQVRMIFGIIALCLMIAGIEWLFGWPDWLVPQSISAKP